MNARILETTQEFDGKDIHARTLYDLSSIPTGEADSLLDLLYYYWSTLEMAQEGPPLASEFKPEPLLQPDAVNFIARIDTDSENPRDFVVHREIPGYSPGTERQAIATRLGELPATMHINALLLDYARCKQWRSPLYHVIDQTMGGVRRIYSRLLLPLADETGVVIQVFYGYRQISGPTRFDLPS